MRDEDKQNSIKIGHRILYYVLRMISILHKVFKPRFGNAGDPTKFKSSFLSSTFANVGEGKLSGEVEVFV